MNYQCTGRVRQRYWGDFSILVLLTFNNEEEARKALPAMQQVRPSAISKEKLAELEGKPHILTDTFMDAVGATCETTGWIQGKEYTDMLLIEVGGYDVDKIITQLVQYGADEPKILSQKHGIDWGEEFTCSVPRVYVDHPNQTTLNI